MGMNNFIQELSELFEMTPKEFSYGMGFTCGLTTVITVYTFLIIFLDAFTVYMGVRMVKFEVKYGRCMILAGLTTVVATLGSCAVYFTFEPPPLWFLVIALALPIFILAGLLTEMETIPFGYALLGSVLATVFRIGVHIVIYLTLFWSLVYFDVPTKVIKNLQEERAQAMERLENIETQDL